MAVDEAEEGAAPEEVAVQAVLDRATACIEKVYDRDYGRSGGGRPAPAPQADRPRAQVAFSEALPAYIVDLTAVDRVRQQLAQAWVGA
eukprot:3004195-Lingulodinium_polyedra.AAC.1